jgi:hypothetical protein
MFCRRSRGTVNKTSLGEVRQYLGLDGVENDKILVVLLSSAEHLVEKVLRAPIREDTPEIVKTAVLFAVWQFYFHRDNKEFSPASLESTVAVMLSDLRRQNFERNKRQTYRGLRDKSRARPVAKRVQD